MYVGALSLTGSAQYIRLGNIVSVSLRAQLTPTAGAPTYTEFSVTLPVASDFTDASQCNGSGSFTYRDSAAVFANTTTNTANVGLRAASTSANEIMVIFNYQIL